MLLLLLVVVQTTILDFLTLGWIGMEISLIVVIYAGFHLDALRGGILSLMLGFFLDCLTSAIFGLYMFLYMPDLLSLHDRRGEGVCGKASLLLLPSRLSARFWKA